MRNFAHFPQIKFLKHIFRPYSRICHENFLLWEWDEGSEDFKL